MHCVVIATLKGNKLTKESVTEKRKEKGNVQQLLGVKQSVIIIIWKCLQRVNILIQNLFEKETSEETFSRRHASNAKDHFGTNLSNEPFNCYECLLYMCYCKL